MAYGAKRRPSDGMHRVQAGETISSISARYGITDWEEQVWNAAENATLKQQRVNPNTLEPGDNVFVPELEAKQETRPVDEWHDFHVVRNKRTLRIKLENEDGEPIAGKMYEFRALSTFRGIFVQQNQSTDAEGFLEEEIPHTMTEADLIVEEAKIHVRLTIGHLLPLPTAGPIKIEIGGQDIGGTIESIGTAGDDALAKASDPAGSSPVGGGALGGIAGQAQDAWGSITSAADDAYEKLAPAVSAAAPLVNAVSTLLGKDKLIEVEDKNIPAAAQRLESIGYDCGKPTSGEPDATFTAALVEFQAWCKRQGLMPADAGGLLGGVGSSLAATALSTVGLTGNLDEATIEALKKVHGC